MKAHKALYKIPLLDVAPAITETAKSLGQLFELIEKALPGTEERLLRLALKQSVIIARNKRKATKAEINEFMDRIKSKKKALRTAKRLNLPLTEIKNDILLLLNDIGDKK
jgi:hypothetical protein